MEGTENARKNKTLNVLRFGEISVLSKPVQGNAVLVLDVGKCCVGLSGRTLMNGVTHLNYSLLFPLLYQLQASISLIQLLC